MHSAGVARILGTATFGLLVLSSFAAPMAVSDLPSLAFFAILAGATLAASIASFRRWRSLPGPERRYAWVAVLAPTLVAVAALVGAVFLLMGYAGATYFPRGLG